VSGAPIPQGKVPNELLARLLGDLPPPGADVLLGPRVGEDAAAVRVPSGVLVAATDPVTLTGSEIGRFAVIVNANDVAVTGARPRWFLAALLLPPGIGEEAVAEIFTVLRRTLDEVGAALVGGHTEVTDAVTRPVVVGQMLGMAEEGRVVTTAGGAAGDVVVQVGPAPVEGAAVLAAEATASLGALDAASVAAAASALDDPGISVVEAALTAGRLGASALHDPTEGGLASGLHELADASGVRLVIDGGTVQWFEPGLAVCRAVGADPWATLASGCLLATFRPGDADAALHELSAAGHTAIAIGRAEAGRGVMVDGTPLAWPERDEVARLLS